MTASVVGYMMRTALHNNRKLWDQRDNTMDSLEEMFGQAVVLSRNCCFHLNLTTDVR